MGEEKKRIEMRMRYYFIQHWEETLEFCMIKIKVILRSMNREFIF